MTHHLARMVTIHEESKRVLATSSEINLVAINAMLMAKRAGSRSRGFSVVAAELRRFSADLDALMREFSGAIARFVRASAQSLREERQHRYLLRAATGRAGVHMQGVLARKAVERAALAASLGNHADDLARRTRQAHRQARAALALARSARIEAVHGGDMAKQLRQVADHVDATVDRIMTSLLALERWIAA